MEITTQEQPKPNLYPHRSSEYIDFYADILDNPPEYPLSPEQKQEVLEFESDLMDGVFRDSDNEIHRTRHTHQSLAELIDNTKYDQKDRWELTLDYFLTNGGKAHLEELGIELPEGHDLDSLAYFFRAGAIDISARLNEPKKKKLKELQIKSEEWAEEKIAKAISESGSIDIPRRITVFSDATSLITRASGLFAYRELYSAAAKEIKELAQDDPDNLELLAKEAVLKIYRKAVNGFLAELEPDLLYLWQQVDCMDMPRREILQETLSIMWPAVGIMEHTHPMSDGTGIIKRFGLRLDRLLNGASVRYDEHGEIISYTAVSEALDKLFEAESHAAGQEKPKPAFSEEEIAKLDGIKLNAQQMQEFCKDILSSLGKLSSEPEETYHQGRPKRAADEKWQVVIREDKTELSIEKVAGVFIIPGNFNRSLTNLNPPAGVVPTAGHEGTHIYQNDNIWFNELGLRIGSKVKGKGNSVLSEAGALYIEKVIQLRLFGRQRGDNPHYMRALKVLEKGGNEIDGIWEFYISSMRANPKASKESTARTAVSRVKRLIRRGGGFNSQPLEYAESALIAEKVGRMSERARNIILMSGAYGLEDMAELHKFGLLDADPEPFPIEQFTGIVEQKLRQKYLDEDSV